MGNAWKVPSTLTAKVGGEGIQFLWVEVPFCSYKVNIFIGAKWVNLSYILDQLQGII